MKDTQSSVAGSGAPLRVLHMAQVRWFNAEAQYALDLAVTMQRRGHSVVYLAQEGSPAAAEAGRAGVPTVEEGGFNGKGVGVLRSLPAAWRLRRRLRALGIQVVEVHRPEGLPLVVWACRAAGVPVVRVRGDMRPVRRDPVNRLLYRRGLAGVVASNSAVERSLRDRLGRLRRLVTIPGGVDPGRFTPEGAAAPVREELGLPPAGLLVGILGRLGQVKGHDQFLEAAHRSIAAGVDAAFAVLVKETTPRAEELRARVAADDLLRGRVGFLGRRDDLPAVLRAFDLGVVASTGSEANCRVGLEWMASGVPLLATRVGVLPDLVADGETGLLVPPGDVNALSEGIRRLGADRGTSRRLGRAARGRVLERFTLERCAASHEALLREALAGVGRDRR